MPETGDLKASDQKRKIRINDTVILYIVFAVMVLFFSLTSEFFYSTYNITTMIANLSFMGIIAAVLTIVMVSGEIDFSIGGNIGLTSCLAAFLIDRGIDGWLVVIICLFMGLAIGVFNGFLVTTVGVNSIIATVGTMSIWRGLAYTLTDGRSILADIPIINYLGYGTILKIPFPIIMFIIIFAVSYLVMNRSKYGRYVYSIGTNPMAAFLSGINVKRIKFLNFIFIGIAASLGGLILTGLTTVGMPQHGQGLELVIISAIILGGTALGGGKGQILGTLVGILILSVLYNGLTMLNVYFYYVQIAQGAVLVLVVASYEIRQKRQLGR